jgi:hypothetical protein
MEWREIIGRKPDNFNDRFHLNRLAESLSFFPGVLEWFQGRSSDFDLDFPADGSDQFLYGFIRWGTAEADIDESL